MKMDFIILMPLVFAEPSEVDRQHLDEKGHKMFAEKYSEFLLTEVL